MSYTVFENHPKKSSKASLKNEENRPIQHRWPARSLSFVYSFEPIRSPYRWPAHSLSFVYNFNPIRMRYFVFIVMFCLQNGVSFGKSQLLNGSTLANPNKRRENSKPFSAAGKYCKNPIFFEWFSNTVGWNTVFENQWHIRLFALCFWVSWLLG